MSENKNPFSLMTIEPSPKRNNANPRRTRIPSHQSNIITHLRNKYYDPAPPNPEEPKTLFSVRKTIPLNTEVIRERSEMIVHPSKISKDVPNWFKGDTYKYYNRHQYNSLNRGYHHETIDLFPREPTSPYAHNRSEISTPRSRKSSDSDNFFFGSGTHDAYAKKVHQRRLQREISPKIGSIDHRNFELPKIPLKIGKNEYIDTHNAF